MNKTFEDTKSFIDDLILTFSDSNSSVDSPQRNPKTPGHDSSFHLKSILKKEEALHLPKTKGCSLNQKAKNDKEKTSLTKKFN